MNCDELQQLAAIAALGALDEADSARLRDRLESDAAARAEFARFCAVAEALAGATAGRMPPPSVRARVLERIRSTPQRRPDPGAAERGDGGGPSVGGLIPGFQFVRHDAPWLPAPLPGARYKFLSGGENQAYAMLLIELAPGAVYPEHDHDGTEEMYVLTGDLQTEGRSLGPGDFLHAEPGTHHQPLRSIAGCTALMVVPRESVSALARV